jgi:hypothetical protein
MILVEGVMAVAEVHVVTRGAGSKFGHVKSAEVDCPCIVQLLQNRCRDTRRLGTKDLASSRGDSTGAIEEILVSKWNSVQATAPITTRQFAIPFASGLEGCILVEANETIECRLPLMNTP